MMTLGNCEPVSFQLCCQLYDITNASMVFQSATATCAALEKEVSFFGSHHMSYPVPTGKNDDFSPWSPLLKKVLKRGRMERGDKRAAVWEYRTLGGASTVATPGMRVPRAKVDSEKTPTILLLTEDCDPGSVWVSSKLHSGSRQKSNPHFVSVQCLDGVSSLFSYLCIYFYNCVS